MYMNMSSMRNKGGLGSLGGSSTSGVGGQSMTLPPDLQPTTASGSTANAVTALTSSDLQSGAAGQAANADLTSGSNAPGTEVSAAASDYAPANGISSLLTNLFGSGKTGQGVTGTTGITIGGVTMSPIILLLLAGGALYLLASKKK